MGGAVEDQIELYFFHYVEQKLSCPCLLNSVVCGNRNCLSNKESYLLRFKLGQCSGLWKRVTCQFSENG